MPYGLSPSDGAVAALAAAGLAWMLAAAAFRRFTLWRVRRMVPALAEAARLDPRKTGTFGRYRRPTQFR